MTIPSRFHKRFTPTVSETNSHFFPIYIYMRAYCGPELKREIGPMPPAGMFISNDGWTEYSIREEEVQFAGRTIEQMAGNPATIQYFYEKGRQASDRLAAVSLSIFDSPLSDASNAELLEKMETYYVALYHAFMYSSILPVRLDLGHLTLTGLLQKTLQSRLGSSKQERFFEYFSALTTPEDLVPTQLEKTALEKIARATKKQQESLLQKHVRDFGWLGFKYNGPSWDANHFRERLAHLMAHPPVEQKNLPRAKEIQTKLNLSETEQNLFELGRMVSWTKIYGKENRFRSYCLVEPLVLELAKRMSMTVKQVKFLTREEIRGALIQGTQVRPIVERRMRAAFYFFLDGNEWILDANHAVDAMDFLRAPVEQHVPDELSGMSVFPGKISGIARVVQTIADVRKVKKGDILVARQTNPDLTLAMEKAGAILTEVGGLSSHAAIVAREMKKPAIVGITGLTRAIADGDKVEVDGQTGKVHKVG